MMIHKITPSEDCNQWLKKLDTQLNEQTNRISTKISKVVKPMNKKTLLLNFGDYSNKQPMSPPSL